MGVDLSLSHQFIVIRIGSVEGHHKASGVAMWLLRVKQLHLFTCYDTITVSNASHSRGTNKNFGVRSIMSKWLNT